MKKGKTTFQFIVNAQPEAINQVIGNFLMVNQFTPQPKPNANYYGFNDPIIKGKRGFEYYINGNQLTILAYIGTFEKPYPLEGFYGSVAKQGYKNELTPLFQELERLNQGNVNVNQMNQQNPGYQTTYQNQAAQNSAATFVEEANKKKEKWAIVGFVISVIGLLLSFLGYKFGLIVYVLEFYCALQGLHTKKKGFSIATFVLFGFSLLILLLEFIGYLFLL